MEILAKDETVAIPETPILRYHQREEYKGEIESMETMLPQLKSTSDRGAVVQRLTRIKQSLTKQSPPEVPGLVKDKLAAEAKALEETIRPGMLSQEEMRKNPAGSVGLHMKWEKAKKAAIMRWKNIQQILEPSSDDPDLSNLEKIRPAGAMDRIRTDAQIGGHMTYQSVPQEKWDTAFEGKGPKNTALQQAKRLHTPLSEEKKDELRARLATARAKMKIQRDAEKAAKAAAQSESEG